MLFKIFEKASYNALEVEMDANAWHSNHCCAMTNVIQNNLFKIENLKIHNHTWQEWGEALGGAGGYPPRS